MNFGIIELVIIAAIIYVAFSKKMKPETRNYVLMALGGLMLIIFLTGGLDTPGTPLSVMLGGENLTNLLILGAVAVYFITNKGDSNDKGTKYVLLALGGYLFFSAAGSTETF